jgi:acetyl-CoA carboxylase biotin carboxyl carrier protein
LFRALIRQKLLCASTVGTFCPSVESGSHVREGMILGRIRRLGRWYDVVVPQGVEGIIEKLVSSYAPVEYGSPLYRIREVLEGRPDGLRQRARRKLHVLKSHLEGTIYHGAEPEARPYAPEGTRVGAHDIIAMVEVMKTFTPIRAPIAGILKKWLVGDGSVIDSAADLAIIEPEETSEVPKRPEAG